MAAGNLATLVVSEAGCSPRCHQPPDVQSKSLKKGDHRGRSRPAIEERHVSEVGCIPRNRPLALEHDPWRILCGRGGADAQDMIYAALNIFFGMASIGLLTVVAIDRYLTICRPDIGISSFWYYVRHDYPREMFTDYIPDNQHCKTNASLTVKRIYILS
ncbi:unnamed protein product [Tetraodon nigroviridis]|uniref:(spotted green pufferfish) hypothetical protein n=1 Tax=Tetraodon nigroviridis TaxID=99883 RepID=Q4SWR8_TETNG|nr:unnamed protein product [Tetraodon nigroviridis]